MGHPAFLPVALPHWVCIAGSANVKATPGIEAQPHKDGVDTNFINTNLDGAAAKLVPAMGINHQPPPTDLTTSTAELPLPPLPSRQSVSKLPPEQTIQQRTAAGELTFIPYVPPAALTMQSQSEELAYAEWLSIFPFAFHATAIPLPTPPDTTIPSKYKEACVHRHATRWRIAMEKEIQSLRDNDTWELVNLPPGRLAFPNKCVFSHVVGQKVIEELERQTDLTKDMRKRLENDGILEKTRLVARGDLQTPGVDYKETFAPVVKFVSLRVLLIYTALRQFQTKHYDIISAFLHGSIDLDIYMWQPYGFEDGTPRVCRLKKAIYGLCQAARQFYKRLDDILTVIGYERLAADWAIWFHSDGAFVAVHVDDMFVAGTSERIHSAYAQLSQHLRLKDLGVMSKYLGLTIEFQEGIFRES